MNYDQLEAITKELHTPGSPLSRIREISHALNQWTSHTSLENLLQLLSDERNRTDITTFTYILSVLENFIVRHLVALMKNTEKQSEIFDNLSKYIYQTGFIRTKLCKCFALLLVISSQENHHSLEACSKFERVVHLEILMIILEELENNDHLLRLRPAVIGTLHRRPDLILSVLHESLKKLVNFEQHKSEISMAVKLLGPVCTTFKISTPELGECLHLVVQFAMSPTDKNVELASQILESLIDLVSGRSKAMSSVQSDYRVNPESLRIFSYVLEAVFQTISQLTINTNEVEASFLSWDSGNSYVPRIIHICRVFMSSHFTYFESKKDFPIMDLLSILFKFTFCQTHTESFLACLEIWDEFLDQLMVLEWSKFMGERPSIQYQQLLVSLFNEALNKAQFQFSSDLLMALDSDEADESGETERSSFITANIEIIARICCLKPLDILTALIPNLKTTVSDFLSAPSNFSDAKILDLGTLLQIAGRLTEHFLGEDFSKFADEVQSLLELILELADMLSNSLQSQMHIPSVIELHCQVLSTLRPYQHWLGQFYHKAQMIRSLESLEQKKVSQVVILSRKVLHISIPLLFLQRKDIEKIQKVAAQLIQCWASIVRPDFVDLLESELKEIYSIGGIVETANQASLSEETNTIILRALSSIFLLPFPNTPINDQRWTERGQLFANLVAKQSNKLDFLNSCCLLVYSEAVACRRACAGGLRSIIISYVSSINTFAVEKANVREAMGLVSNYFVYLKQEATKDVELCRQTVQACYNDFTVEKANDLLLTENGVQFLENMSKIISAVVEYSKDPEILPIVLDLTMNILLPASEMSPPVHSACLSLLKKIISAKWRYFFPGNVLAKVFDRTGPTITNEHTLLQIIRYFISAIISTDLTLSRNALTSLLELQKERKFFSNDAVRVKINPAMVQAIVPALLAGQHLIVEDELITILHHTFYENKTSDVQSIFNNCLPKHMENYATPSLNTDFPTFLTIIRSVLTVSRE